MLYIDLTTWRDWLLLLLWMAVIFGAAFGGSRLGSWMASRRR